MCHNTHVKVGGQITREGSLLPCGSCLGPNTGPKACQYFFLLSQLASPIPMPCVCVCTCAYVHTCTCTCYLFLFKYNCFENVCGVLFTLFLPSLFPANSSYASITTSSRIHDLFFNYHYYIWFHKHSLVSSFSVACMYVCLALTIQYCMTFQGVLLLRKPSLSPLSLIGSIFIQERSFVKLPPHPLWHVNQYCHYTVLLQVTTVSKFSLMFRRHYGTADAVALGFFLPPCDDPGAFAIGVVLQMCHLGLAPHSQLLSAGFCHGLCLL